MTRLLLIPLLLFSCVPTPEATPRRLSAQQDANIDDGSTRDSGVETGVETGIDAGTIDTGPGFIDTGTVDSGTIDTGTPSSCALPQPFDQNVTYSQTLHVAVGGSGDGSANNPFGSIENAAQRATPGTRILVAAGTYGSTSLPHLVGEPNRPIAIAADGPVILDAAGAQTVMRMTDPAYVVIEGFTMENASVHGLNIDDGGDYDTPAHHLILRGLTMRNIGSGGNNDCIKLSGVDDFFVLDSDVSGCDHGEIIDMVGCHNGLIARNHFHDTVVSGVQAKGGSSGTIIHGNLFSDIPGRAVNAGGSTGLSYLRPTNTNAEAANLQIVSNVFLRVGQTGGAPVAYVGCDGCLFANNTIIDPRTWVARILQESTDTRFVPSRNGIFVNNLIVLQTSDVRSVVVNIGAHTAPETFTFGSNLWYARDIGASWSPSIPAEIPPESGSFSADPDLSDRASGDYHLSATSPARQAGRDIQNALPDFDGNCFNTPRAIGAFEVP